MNDSEFLSRDDQSLLSRRDFLRGTGAVAMGVGSVALLGLGRGRSLAPAGASAPRRGGTLTLASTGGSSADTLDANNALNVPDFPRVLALNNLLIGLGEGAPGLASEVLSNKDASVWTIRLRPGITCHNGAKFEAADVLYTFQRVANPKHPLPGASSLAPIDLANAKIVDPLTLQLPCKMPYSVLPQALANDAILMVPRGYDPKHPIGTGPFKLKSFTPGVESVMTRFDEYWLDGQPYADEFVVTDYEDSTAQVNALISGAANIADYLTEPTLSAVRNGGANVVVSHTGSYNPITMRVDMPPFNDVRVRQAFRLIADRPQFLTAVFGGYGIAGNDVFSIFDPAYDHALPQRHQDIEQAKFLLKAAGQENLSITLVTSPGIAPVVVPEATVFAQQAQAAGVKVNLQNVQATDYWSKYYEKVAFSQDNWSYAPYLIQVNAELLPSSPYNETHYDNPRYIQLYNEALRTIDPTLHTELIHEMQQIDYNSGTLLIPYFAPMFDGVGKGVGGVVPNRIGIPLDNYNSGGFWIA
jgi:peptide/nickel transport system substrate-binding protein